MRWAPYQIRWLTDPSDRTLYVKSRRVGISEATAFKAACAACGIDLTTTPARRVRPSPQAFISASQEQSKDYLARAVNHIEAFHLAGMVKDLLPRESERSVFKLRLRTGVELRAFSANPRSIRGFEGDLNLDEFGAMPRAKDVWAAAKALADPTLRNPRGYKIRVTGTPLGDDNLFYEMAHGKAGAWSVHRTSIVDAVADGFPLRGTMDELRDEIGDPDVFEQEYMCSFLSASTRFISAELYDAHLYDDGDAPKDAGTEFAGMDVARKRDYSAIARLLKVGDTYWHQGTEARRGEAWAEQEAWVAQVMGNAQRLAVDASGMGSQFAERLVSQYGASRVSPVEFTVASKERLATGAKLAFSRGRLRMRRDDVDTRRDVLNLRRNITQHGNVTFDAPVTKSGHADRAWALALAIDAGGGASKSVGGLAFTTAEGHARSEIQPAAQRTRLWG